MMDRTDRTTAEKLGIKAGARVAWIDPPADYLRVLGKLPKDAALEEHPDEALPLRSGSCAIRMRTRRRFRWGWWTTKYVR